MRFNRDNTLWYVLAGLGIVYLLSLALTGGALNLGATAFRVGMTLLALVLAITVHEFAHAWSADLLGDPTARLAGRVTLNPIAHLDPLGSLMMILTTFTGIGIGWGKPTPVTPHRLRHGSRLGYGLVALFGPISNVLLAAVLGLVLRLVPIRTVWLFSALATIVQVNLIIAFFNLLPLPPLDGHSVLLGGLSLSRSRWAWSVSQFLWKMQSYGPMLLIGVLILSQFLRLPILFWLVGVPAEAMRRLIMG